MNGNENLVRSANLCTERSYDTALFRYFPFTICGERSRPVILMKSRSLTGGGGGLGRLFRSRVTRLESLSIPFVIIYSSDISVYFHSSSLRVISALRSLTRRGRRREKDRRRRRRRRASWMSLTRFAHYRDLASILISHLADVPDDEWFIDPNPISPTL